jgi:hypothetical protein
MPKGALVLAVRGDTRPQIRLFRLVRLPWSELYRL